MYEKFYVKDSKVICKDVWKVLYKRLEKEYVRMYEKFYIQDSKQIYKYSWKSYLYKNKKPYI